jgi:ubiquinone biosynthesis protein COQ4
MSNLVSSSPPKWRQRPRRIARWWAALKALFLMIASERQRNSQGMRYLFLTGDKAFERMLSAFRQTPDGRELLRLQPKFSRVYASRGSIKAYPPGSLGQWYVAFMRDFGLTEETYLSIAVEHAARLAQDSERAWFHLRFDSSHDIRHVLAGYGPDRLGEICLLCFRYGQIRHRGIIVLIFLSVFNLIFVHRGRGLLALWEAYRRGRRARLLDLLPWENGLAEPLAVHRATLGLTPPQFYPCSFASEAYLKSNLQAEYDEPGRCASTNRAFEAIWTRPGHG